MVKQHLFPAGFVQSHASTYVRRVGEVLEVINFQSGTWGKEFTVNLGLHYTFTPPVAKRRRMRWTAIDHLDCSIRGRIGFFLPRKLDTWFDFGEDPDALAAHVKYCIDQSLRIFGKYTPRLTKPSLIPPKLVWPFWIGYAEVLYASIEMRLGRIRAAETRLHHDMVPAREGVFPRYRQLLRQIEQLRRAQGDANGVAKVLTWLT